VLTHNDASTQRKQMLRAAAASYLFMSADGAVRARVGDRRDGHACKGTRSGSARKQGIFACQRQGGRTGQVIDRHSKRSDENQPTAY
jgi:hypothetical protein